MNQRSETANIFFRFEAEQAGLIAQHTIIGFLAWPVIKSNLAYSIVRDRSEGYKQGTYTQGKLRRGIAVMGRLISLPFQLLTLRRKKKTVLLYTRSWDKLTKINGKYFNFLMDGFITTGAIRNYLYAAVSFHGDFREPGTVPIDLKIDHLVALYPIINLTKKEKAEVAVLTGIFYKALDDFFIAQNFNVKVDKDRIQSALINFIREYRSSLVFLKYVKPAFIITAEKPGTGFCAAARTKQIRLVDLQHGLIDLVEPMYQYHAALKPVKNKMALPDLIGLWGRQQLSVLLKNAFWDEEDFVILGSYRVDAARSGSSLVKKKNLVVCPTQWIVFEETKTLLGILEKIPDKDFVFVLKMHPREPETFRNYYVSYAAENAAWMKIADPLDDIFSLFSQARLVIGFNSASLIEAAALSVPSITLLTPDYPHGVFEYTEEFETKGIRKISLDDEKALTEAVQSVMKDDVYREWAKEAEKTGAWLFEPGYEKNIRRFIENFTN